MSKKKIFSGVLAIILIFSLSFSGISVQAAQSNDSTQTADTASQVVENMGVGWNLGNALDSWSSNTTAYETAMQKRADYQLMATYSTKSYSGWDASSAPYFSATTSTCDLTWKITKLNSSKTQACGNFGFQIINNSLNSTGTGTVNFTVTKAQFTTASGEVITLNDMLGNYSKTITKSVTAYVKADLTKYPQLATSASLIGGSLSISVKINSYPLPITTSITKEAYYEKAFGNPTATKAMIDKVKEAGFGAIRIPVTFFNHMDANGNIDQAWLARVAEVVNYVRDNNIYCIIDVQHDTGSNGWLKADASTFIDTSAKFKNVWTQIATYFKDYNQKLLFEGYNEILNSSNQWNYAGNSSYDVANKLNQVFVDTVRSTGGNNKTRNLIVNTYAASTEPDVIKNFKLPTDTVNNHLIVEAHYYGATQSLVSTVLSRLNNTFISKGIPVIIGEFGSTFKTSEADRITLASYYVKTAKQYHITCFWWDDGNYTDKAGAKCNYALFDRSALAWYYPSISKALVAASK